MFLQKFVESITGKGLDMKGVGLRKSRSWLSRCGSRAKSLSRRLRAIANGVERIKAKSFRIDGEAVVLGSDGLLRFEELNSREAAETAILFASDLIEHDGEDMRNRPFLDPKATLARLSRNTKPGILFNEHIVEDGISSSRTPVRRCAEGIVSKKVDGTYRSGRCPVWIKSPQSRQHRRAAGEDRDLE